MRNQSHTRVGVSVEGQPHKARNLVLARVGDIAGALGISARAIGRLFPWSFIPQLGSELGGGGGELGVVRQWTQVQERSAVRRAEDSPACDLGGTRA